MLCRDVLPNIPPSRPLSHIRFILPHTATKQEWEGTLHSESTTLSNQLMQRPALRVLEVATPYTSGSHFETRLRGLEDMWNEVLPATLQGRVQFTIHSREL